MENGGPPTVSVRKTALTPKAIINQKFGSKACYKVEEVQEFSQNGCPGLAISQKGPSLYRCKLELPEFSVVSNTCRKKKEAEQSAAEMALEKLGHHTGVDNSSEQDPSDALVERIAFLFSDEFLLSLHPLSGHLRAALLRGGDLYGLVPSSVIAACDTKSSNLCKSLNPMVESNPALALPFIMRAATRLSASVVTPQGKLSIRKQNPYPPEILDMSDIQQSDSQENILVEAIYIPASLDLAIQSVALNVSSTGYYLDVIAHKLGVTDASNVLLSRTIGKASSDTRLYYAAPESLVMDLSSDSRNGKVCSKRSLNATARYFCGQNIDGDAIMASIGYTWRSKDLFHEDVSLQSCHRMLISKIPSGIYKLSREAILAADLPSAFTTKSNWRGTFPKEILCSFCRQHRLSEPVFSAIDMPIKASSESSTSQKKLKVTEMAECETKYANGRSTGAGDCESEGSEISFRCEIKIYSKSGGLIVECSPKEIYKKQTDCIHNASLKVLSWLNGYLKDCGMHFEKLNSSADVLNIKFNPDLFFKELVLCPSSNVQRGGTLKAKLLESKFSDMPCTFSGQGIYFFNIEGLESGVCPSNGTLLCISYSVTLVTLSGHMKELLESNEEFEFEVGTGAIISPLEAVLTHMSVGQSAVIIMDSTPLEFILAAAIDSGSVLSLLSSQECYLQYAVTSLRITEPPEERMEQALFSPPLSKQRVEYAVKHIIQSSAATLVDFGCGSGSLLESLLDYETSLEKIVGVDLSQKGLSRAAKILHSKLSLKSDTNIKCAALYDGSITDFDSRLCGFDIGTCLEVIEHMEEEQACHFGNIALSYFRPKILIVSTPNYEYNVILQRTSPTGQDDDLDEKAQQSCKFRNHDHKFEWTRAQFNHWASELAERHNYSVEFSGVGGSADVGPGFASQIAVFTRRTILEEVDIPMDDNSSTQHCKVVWEWNSSIKPEFSDRTSSRLVAIRLSSLVDLMSRVSI